MVVSRSAMMPETALAAVMQAWVPLFPACRADSTRETCGVGRGGGVSESDHMVTVTFAHAAPPWW